MKIITTIPNEDKFFISEEIGGGNVTPETEMRIINIFDEIEYQSVLGFGGAFTESAAYNYSLMDDKTKTEFITAYFDKKNGIGYNFGRTHISSCDFSLDIYSNVKSGDKTLESFNIERDKKYIIPFVKDALKHCEEELVLFASPWSPPAYMKDNASSIRGGRLLEEYKLVWALYYAKYIKAYRAEGINISAISIQNEPKALQTWESCYYSSQDEYEFLRDFLIPTLDKEDLSDIKIIIWDHNKERVYDRTRDVLKPDVAERVWAVGHHWYSGDHFEGLRLVHERFNKPLICTEFCGTIDGSALELAEHYAKEMCENFNNYMTASCDWNILLDTNGGPHHNRTNKESTELEKKDGGCYAPILYDTENGRLIKTPIYYYIGHFSKFVKRDAKRIATTKFTDKLYVTAFKNPDGEIVAVILNPCGDTMTANIRFEDTVTKIELQAHSIATLIL